MRRSTRLQKTTQVDKKEETKANEILELEQEDFDSIPLEPSKRKKPIKRTPDQVKKTSPATLAKSTTNDDDENVSSTVEAKKPRRSKRISEKKLNQIKINSNGEETWEIISISSDEDFQTPKVIPKKNQRSTRDNKKATVNLATPESLDKFTKKTLKKESIREETNADDDKDPQVIITSSDESEFKAESPLPSDDSPLSAVNSDSDDAVVVVETRRAPRRGGRTNNRRSRAKEEKIGGFSKSYLRTHPTVDPRVQAFHPEVKDVWDKLDGMEVIEIEQSEQPNDLKLKLLPFQKEGLNWMKKQEQSEFMGGILADEMGMGKTIQMISLLLSEPRGKPNLLVAPTVALMQWLNEINTHTTTLNVLLYYGQDRTRSLAELKKYDIILTTYNIIESGFRKQNYGFTRKGEKVKESSPIHQTDWFRVILDEGHYIKDRSCSTARAVFALKAQRKWALTGTPLQNRVGELYSLIRFLKCDPFSYYFCRDCDCKSLTWAFKGYNSCDACGHSPMKHFCWWNAEILKPIQNYGNVGEGKLGFEKLTKLLDKVMLRRTKVEKADDLGLPPKIVTVRRDVFNEEEEDMYESLYTDSKRKFSTYVEEGTVLNHYANIFELITKMRLAVNHPDLILRRIPMMKNGNLDPNKRLTQIKNSLICGLCQDEAEDPIISKCKHVFCREDIRQFLDSSLDSHPKCPTCYVPLTIDLSQDSLIPENDEEEIKEAEKTSHQINDKDFKVAGETFRGSIVNRIDMKKWRSSTKIEALVEELDKLRSQDHTIKSIVFSQFVNFLDLVAWRLHRAGFACCRLDGRMRPAQRDAIIKTFMQRHEYTVFLISLKAGGIALNLTEASRVFICDPWWNPAVEDQAMDRIHRLGQYRPIQVTRLVVENSIESRILQLQAKKHALFQSTIGKDTSALSKLTEEDLKFLFVL
ncbi:hypothetical protein K502DRAFT_325583 [Neoconidiobolus thromboides FSU 785]|nr:hypothetical protein K502DRAFT_325583 [Neoconidiobolus thromboides FSU 785]